MANPRSREAQQGRSALVRQYGEHGASYLEHLREVTSNQVVQSAVAELERKAEEQGTKA